ncbi:SUKH-4 family immunity protein [Streptomyces sp. NPDC056503]|uniref:SUKH-4 family immunity protein n=1 Tax=Streptomyces sp. NPDC056503 TaxID=3345842 RepID=UPI0036C6DBB7
MWLKLNHHLGLIIRDFLRTKSVKFPWSRFRGGSETTAGAEPALGAYAVLPPPAGEARRRRRERQLDPHLPGHVTRAGRDVAVGWRIPDSAKAQLVEVGIPVAPRLIERVVMQSEDEPALLTSRGPLYRLTEQTDPDDQAEGSSFGIEPETGAVYFVMPDGEAWFADSGVGVWLDVLHCYGSRVTTSRLLSEPDGPEEYFSEKEEERAFAELNRLAEELKEIDPAAFNGYAGFLWPGLLDRWIY